jgi:hypothetical protein
MDGMINQQAHSRGLGTRNCNASQCEACYALCWYSMIGHVLEYYYGVLRVTSWT